MQTNDRLKYLLSNKFSVGIFVASVIVFFGRYLWGYPEYLAFFDDDFFYYAKTAENFAFSIQSSFNGIYLTNGYHPLYFLILSIISYSKILNESIFFLLVSIMATFSIAYTYKITHSTILSITKNESSAILGGLTISFVSLLIIKGGMEIILTIPLILYFIKIVIEQDEFGKYSSLKLGLLVSLIILSRLDSIIFIVLLFTVLLLAKAIKFNYRYLLFGLLPVFLYLIINYYFFGIMIPVSGLAKQMKTNIIPTRYTFISSYYFSPNRIVYAIIPSFLNIIALFVWIRKHHTLDKKIKFISLVSFLFPIVFIINISAFSGWGLWPWYFYIFIPVLLHIFIIFPVNKILLKLINCSNGLFLVLIILYCTLFVATKKPSDYEFYTSAVEISKFEETHKGIYAMGDRAGLAGYLLQSPVIQTEGLMMDKTFLENLKVLDLNTLLKQYKVQYFIANNPQYINKRWFAEEPHNHCGSNITSKGYFDYQPIDSVISGKWKNYVFVIHK